MGFTIDYRYYFISLKVSGNPGHLWPRIVWPSPVSRPDHSRPTLVLSTFAPYTGTGLSYSPPPRQQRSPLVKVNFIYVQYSCVVY